MMTKQSMLQSMDCFVPRNDRNITSSPQSDPMRQISSSSRHEAMPIVILGLLEMDMHLLEHSDIRLRHLDPLFHHFSQERSGFTHYQDSRLRMPRLSSRACHGIQDNRINLMLLDSCMRRNDRCRTHRNRGSSPDLFFLHISVSQDLLHLRRHLIWHSR